MSTVTFIHAPPPGADWWVLSAEAGPSLDALVGVAVNAGLTVEVVRPGAAYRVAGDTGLRAEFAVVVNEYDPGATFTIESPPTDTIALTARVASPLSARTTYVHGSQAAALVARAIDAGLTVRPVGTYRFAVQGSTTAQVGWLAQALGKSVAEVLAEWGLTPEAIAAEDVPEQVRIVMPTRQTTSVIERDQDGGIAQVVQTETTTH